MAFPFFGGASVIVCQGADLLAIRPRRPPQGDTTAVTVTGPQELVHGPTDRGQANREMSWITAVIHDERVLGTVKPLDRVTFDPQTCETDATKAELPNADHHCDPSTAPVAICYIIAHYR